MILTLYTYLIGGLILMEIAIALLLFWNARTLRKLVGGQQDTVKIEKKAAPEKSEKGRKGKKSEEAVVIETHVMTKEEIANLRKERANCVGA